MILYAADLETVHARLPQSDAGAVVRHADRLYRRVGVRVRGARDEAVYREQAPPRPRPSDALDAWMR